MIEMSDCCSGSVDNPSGIGNEGRCNDCKEMCAIVRFVDVKQDEEEYEGEFTMFKTGNYWNMITGEFEPLREKHYSYNWKLKEE